MLLTLKTKLKPTIEQRLKLLKTMESFNAVCNDISKDAIESRAFSKYSLQHQLYYRVREQYRLSTQLRMHRRNLRTPFLKKITF
jgi:predicted transposase